MQNDFLVISPQKLSEENSVIQQRMIAKGSHKCVKKNLACGVGAVISFEIEENGSGGEGGGKTEERIELECKKKEGKTD